MRNWLCRLICLTVLMFGCWNLAYADEAGELNAQVIQLYRQGHYAKAVPLAERCAELRKKILGADHPLYATSLNNLALLYDSMGNYVQALPLYQQSLEIRKKALGAEHPDYAASLNNLAVLYDNLGYYDKALPLYQRALAIDEKILGVDHPDTAIDLNNLADSYRILGQYDRALPLFLRVLAIREKSLGPEHPDTALSLNNLALLYDNLGEYDKALPLYQRALVIRAKVLGLTHPETANSLNNLAALYEALGQYEKSLPLKQRALAIHENVFGPEHALTAVSMNNLAMLYKTLGQYDQALPLYQRALAIREKAFGPEHALTAASLNNLAALYQTLGQYDQALPLYQRALAIKEKTLGSVHPDIAISLNNLAMLYQTLGQYDQALPLYQRAVAIEEKSLGPEHVDTATCLNNLAFLYGIQRHSRNALGLYLRGSVVTRHVIARTFSIMSEQEKLQFVRKQEEGYFGLLSLIHRQLPNDAEAVRAGLDTVLSRKGIVFDAQARQQEAIANSLDPETKKLWDELSQQRALLAKQMQSGPGKLKPEDYQAKLKALQDIIPHLESRLASKSALIAQDLKQRNITTKEVIQALGKEAALVEYIRIQDYDWDKGKWADTSRYLAFILKGDGLVKLVDLGDAAVLEQEVQAALKAIGQVGSDLSRQQDATRVLNQRLWAPLAEAVGNTPKVVFSPDGILNLVPFAAMQNEKGRYLVEDRQISYVTSGRDLTKGDLGIKPQSELYLAANPQFDLNVAPSQPAGESRGAVRSANFDLRFAPLPGTAREADQIPAYLSGKKTVLTGKDATEDSVLNAPRARVMHLSTHGFFLADQPALAQDTRGAVRIKGKEQPRPDQPSVLPKGYENPLVRSGLAFAGANHAREANDGHDGLLTALEVSGMDLHGTDLVTLSACETGRGEVKSGEGVFGLRRAFALTGASHLMMSLWPVSDAVTAQQMQRFYQLYGQHTEPAAALRQAQLATIANLRERKGTAEPALWAPFIVQGK